MENNLAHLLPFPYCLCWDEGSSYSWVGGWSGVQGGPTEPGTMAFFFKILTLGGAGGTPGWAQGRVESLAPKHGVRVGGRLVGGGVLREREKPIRGAGRAQSGLAEGKQELPFGPGDVLSLVWPSLSLPLFSFSLSDSS